MDRENKIIVNGFLICFTAGILSLVIFFAYKDFKRDNELCKNGERTLGYVYRLEEDNMNEGNIHSLDIFYRFEGVGRSYWGEINVSDDAKVKVGDSVNIIHFKADPNDHEASLDKFNSECSDPSFVSFVNEHLLILVIGIAGALGISLFMIGQGKDSNA